MSRFIFCVKLQQEKEGFDTPPYPGPLGERIYEQISKEAWQAWLKHQTLLINEHRLNMTKPDDRHFLKTEMERYFFGDGGVTPSGYTPPEADT